MIGIIGAVVEEAEAIKKEIKNIKENVINGISFFIGKCCFCAIWNWKGKCCSYSHFIN